MTRQEMVDKILLSKILDTDKQIKYFQRGFLQKISNDPPDYFWKMDKFQWYSLEDIKEILEDVT